MAFGGSGAFEGFGPDSKTWFEGLAADNSKAYYEVSLDLLETQVRAPLKQLLDAAAFRMEGEVKLFRQNRDVRFSKDKSPYKVHSSGYVHNLPGKLAGGYIQIGANGVTAATGLWEVAADQLARARAAIATDPDAADALAEAFAAGEAAGCEHWGEALKTAPRGFDKNHPHIALLRKKNFVLARSTDDWALICSDEIYDWALESWAAGIAMNAWLDSHVGPSEMTYEERFGNKR